MVLPMIERGRLSVLVLLILCFGSSPAWAQDLLPKRDQVQPPERNSSPYANEFCPHNI